VQHDATPRLLRWARANRGPLLFVGLPTLLAMLYYFLIASDLYASEARIVVRSPARMQVSGLAGLLQGSGISRAQDDVYSVHDFILSRDAIAAAGKRLDLRAIFSRPGADFIARYPNPWHRDTSEDFYKYWQHRVEVVFDTTSGICTLTVKAFRAEDAQALAQALLDESEGLVNRLNERSHANAIRDAEAEVRQVEQNVADAQAATLAYRKRETLIDPGKASGAIMENQARLQAELVQARARLGELQRSSPNSPLRADLQAHVTELERQVGAQRSELAGGDGSMAPKISEYEQLQLRQEFAAKELASALASLESARAEARRQQIYLDRVVEPNLPDKALFPKRLISVLIVFISAFLIYSIGRLLLAGVQEHAQD
jgi:capsular polysaccharide transport system permease protein